MKKKLVGFLCCTLLLVSVCGCGKKQEEEERKAEERANRGGKPYIPTRPYNPSDERQQTKPADKAPIAAPLEAEALEDAFEDMADGGF